MLGDAEPGTAFLGCIAFMREGQSIYFLEIAGFWNLKTSRQLHSLFQSWRRGIAPVRLFDI
jgi:hypothetical protein